MIYKLFEKISALLAPSETLAKQDKSAFCSSINSENISNKELAEELHKTNYLKI